MCFLRFAGWLVTSTLTLQASADWRTIAVDSYPAEARAQIGAARDAAAQRPTDAAVLGQLGLVLHAWEQYEVAAQAYADARRLAPRDVTWWALSGSLATRMGRHEPAAEYFGTAAGLQSSPLLALRYADALLESGMLDAARAAYDLAVAMPDAEPAARYGLGRLAVAKGDTNGARTQFERAVSLVPTFGAAHYALAQVQRKQGDLAGARLSLARQQQCLACWPIPDDPYSAMVASVRDDAAALLARALRAAGMKDDAGAIALHEAALAKKPDSLQARTNLITLYARTGNLERAEEQYRAVVGSGTQLAEAHRTFGLALASAGDPGKAEPILRLAIEANPLDAASHNTLGLILESAKRMDDAEAAYLRAVDADPRTRGYRYNYVRTLVARGRLDEALTHLAAMATPDDAESVGYAFARSAVYVRKGDIINGRRLGEDALARARRHGLTDLAATIERDLQKLK